MFPRRASSARKKIDHSNHLIEKSSGSACEKPARDSGESDILRRLSSIDIHRGRASHHLGLGSTQMPEETVASDLRTRVICVGNEKGGSGKSTVAIHIAIALLRAQPLRAGGRRSARPTPGVRQSSDRLDCAAQPAFDADFAQQALHRSSLAGSLTKARLPLCRGPRRVGHFPRVLSARAHRSTNSSSARGRPCRM